MGCAGLRQRLAHRSAECTQLCEDARQAREAGQETQAEQLLNEAIRQRPTDTQTRLDLAEELWSSGRQIAAADVLAKMVAERPDDAPSALKLARMEFEIGRLAAAESALRLSMMHDSENPEALRLKAEIAERNGQWDLALATYHRLVQMLPDDVNAQLAMAKVYRQRGQADCAAPILRSVVQRSQVTAKQRRDAEWELGLSYAQIDRWSDAAAALQNAVSQGESTAEEWYQVAYAQARVGNQTAAYDSISRSLQLQPNYGASLELARGLKLSGDLPADLVVPASFVAPVTASADLPSNRARL